jgi:NADH dehydrogenase FAD-containing subunit
MIRSGRRLLLIGGGPAQLFVLEALVRRKLTADEVVLVSPHSGQLHSAMVPGLIEGRYTIDQLTLDLPALARAAGATFIEDSVTRIDAASRIVTLAGGKTLEYDVASIAIGGTPAGAEIPGVRSHAHFLTPIDRVAALVPAMERAAQNAGPEPLQVVVVGAGAAGVEIALTTRARLDRLGANRAIITLVDASHALLRHAGPAAEDAAEQALRRGDITLRLSTGVEEVGPAHVRVTGGRVIPADLILWCTGTEAPTLFRDSGLPVDARGYLTVDDTLAVPEFVGLFAAGDSASLRSAPRLPKSGVSSARQGPVLAHNLAAALAATSTVVAAALPNPSARPYRPQTRPLALLNTGDGRAIFSYAGVVTTTRWAMRLKDRIDRRLVRRFQRLY